MAQAVWNGFLRLSLVSCPIHLSAAMRESGGVELDQLNPRTGNPVTQQYLDAKTGDVVAPESLVKGYPVPGSGHVSFSEQELTALAGQPSDIVDITKFVPRDQVDRSLLETGYYIYPEGQLASDTVHALRLAMQRSARLGIGSIHLAGRTRSVLIEPHGAGLVMSTVRRLPEIVPPEFSDRPESEIPAEMIEIAETIIARRAANFDPDALRDRYDEKLRVLIEQKAGGAASAPVAATQPPPEIAAAEPEPSPPPAADAAPPEPAPTPEPAAAHEETEPEAVPEPAPEIETAPSPAEPPPASQAEAHYGDTPAAMAEAEPAPLPEPDQPAAGEAPPRELGTEILLHIMGLGDRRYVEPGWAGHPGSRRQIEAISIRPREGLPASTVEFRVFAQEGRATAWVSNGNYAGTRGRGLPLTGFAVRPSPELRERYDIVYEGCFFDGGVVGPKRNGELCMSSVANDPLEAVRVSIFEHESS